MIDCMYTFCLDASSLNFPNFLKDFLSHSKSHTAAAAAAGYSRLLVVDFDSTLFCSPLPNPELWSSEVVGSVISNCNWFQQLKTLSFPYIPDIPGPDWWDGGVVDTVMNANIDDGSNTNSKTLKILLTGRLDSIFSPRIHHLIATCSCGNLDFDL